MVKKTTLYNSDNEKLYPRTSAECVGYGDGTVKDALDSAGVGDYPVFSTSTAYSTGDVVNYNGKLYKFTADHAAGAWTGTDAEETDIIKAHIVQELGDNEDKVVSQKAVTLSLRNTFFSEAINEGPYVFKSFFKSIYFYGFDLTKTYFLRQFVYGSSSLGVFIQIEDNDGNQYNFTTDASHKEKIGSIINGNKEVRYEIYDDVEENTTFFNGNNSPYTNILSIKAFPKDYQQQVNSLSESYGTLSSSLGTVENNVSDLDEKSKTLTKEVSGINSMLNGGSGVKTYNIDKESAINQFIDTHGYVVGNIGMTTFWTTELIEIEIENSPTKAVLKNLKVGSNWLSIAFYSFGIGGKAVFISGNALESSTTAKDSLEIDIPENATHFRLCQTEDTLSNFSCEFEYAETAGIVQKVDTLSDDLDEIKKKPLEGKSVLMFGDSFIDYGKFPKAVSELLGCTIINRGVGGSTIVRRDDKPNQSLICRLKEEEGAITSGNGAALPESCDLIIVHAGINDFIQWKGLGNIELGLSDDTKIYSAIQIILNGLMEKYPGIPIIWDTPCHLNTTSGNKDLSYDESDKTLTETKNGYTLRQLRQAILECCALYSVRVADMYADSGIFPLLESNKSLFTDDGLHPSEAGSKLLANVIKKTIDL